MMAMFKTLPILPEKGIRHMAKTTIPNPDGFSVDPLTNISSDGAHDLIQKAVGAELSVLPEAHSGDRTETERAQLVHYGQLPAREIITGIGAVPVKVPRVHDPCSCAEKNRLRIENLATLFAQTNIGEPPP